MNGINDRKAQWEREARQDERKLIVELVRSAEVAANTDMNENKSGIAAVIAGTLEGIREAIERGEHRKDNT